MNKKLTSESIMTGILLFVFVFVGIRMFDLALLLGFKGMNSLNSEDSFKYAVVGVIAFIAASFSIVFIILGYLRARIKDLERKVLVPLPKKSPAENKVFHRVSSYNRGQNALERVKLR